MKMRKGMSICLTLAFLATISFNAFASNATRVNNSNITRKTTNETKNTFASDKADYDLVRLNQNMLYSQLVNISNDYEKYLGKTIRLSGVMNVVNGGENNYYIVECSDNTSCCNQGLEFILKGGSTDEKDYPKTGDRVLVNGKLEKYNEGSNTYIHLVNSECEVLKEGGK